MLKVIKTVAEFIAWRAEVIPSARIGFVPTMGNLHMGHQSLLERAASENNITVLSIFVNPTQFTQSSDFENYPKTIAADLKIAEQAGISVVFAPLAADLYPDHYQIQVCDTQESMRLEGVHRPGHFTGMLTIVLKLLQLVRPTNAYFGEKDYQQLCLVQQLVRAFFLPSNIIACATVRYPSQLPFSSRNSRLSPAQLARAHEFARIIRQNKPLSVMIAELQAQAIRIDYLEDHDNRRFAAIWLDDIRLIDNFSLLEE